jgi:hypothetical protein
MALNISSLDFPFECITKVYITPSDILGELVVWKLLISYTCPTSNQCLLTIGHILVMLEASV